MKILSEEKIRVLAERNGWSPEFTEGHIDGEIFRRRGMTPSKSAQIGIDEYSLGFRAGYYERSTSDQTSPVRPDARVRPRRNAAGGP